jgi:hypothetical protein
MLNGRAGAPQAFVAIRKGVNLKVVKVDFNALSKPGEYCPDPLNPKALNEI